MCRLCDLSCIIGSLLVLSASLTGIKQTLTKKQLGEERMIGLTPYSLSPREDKAGMQDWNLEAETEADTTQELKMFTGFLSLASTFINTSGPAAQGQWAIPHSSISNRKMPYRRAHRPIWCSFSIKAPSFQDFLVCVELIRMNQHATPVHFPSLDPAQLRPAHSAESDQQLPTTSPQHAHKKTLTLIFKILVAFARCLASKQEVQLG